MTEVERLHRTIAGFGLPGSRPGPLDVPPGSWPALLATMSSGRTTGIAVAAAEAGHLRLNDGQFEELVERQRDAMVWALGIERRLLRLAGSFEGAGVSMLVLKGPAVAHSVYPDPSWRAFGDLDLLVPTSSWGRALQVLADLGMDRRLPEPRPGFDVRFGKAALHRNGDGVEIDLHRTLVIGPFGLWIDPDELAARSVTFEIGGRALRRLDDATLMLHACVHASLGWRPPLVWTLRDVAQVAWSGRVDWDELAFLTRRWRLAAVVRHALESTTETLEVDLPPEVKPLLAMEPSRREQRILESYVTERRGFGGTELATLWAIPGLRARAAYVRALLFPGREFLAARGRGSISRLTVPARWLAGRRR